MTFRIGEQSEGYHGFQASERLRRVESRERIMAHNADPTGVVTAASTTLLVDYTNWDLYLNDTGGAGIGTSWQLVGGGGGAAPHNILSPTHTDAATQAVTRGSLIYADATPEWNELVYPADDRILITETNDVRWSDANFTYDFTLGELLIIAKNDAAEPLTIRANSPTQTANLFEAQTSAGTDRCVIDFEGKMALANAAATTGFNWLSVVESDSTGGVGEVWSTINVGSTMVINHATTNFRAIEAEARNTAGTNAPVEVAGVSGLAAYGNTINSASIVAGIRGTGQATSTGNVTNLAGGRFIGVKASTGATRAMGVQAIAQRSGTTAGQAHGVNTQVQATGSGNISLGAGVYIEGSTKGGPATFTANYGIYIEDQVVGTTDWAILTNAGLVTFNEGGDSSSDVRIEGDTETHLFFSDAGNERIGIAESSPDVRLHTTVVDAVTAAVTDILRLTHENTGGTPASGFGAGLEWELESTVQNRIAATDEALWNVATDATRSAIRRFEVLSNTNDWEFLRLFGDNSQAESVFNESQNDIDFRVESDTETHAIFMQASSGYSGFGKSVPDTRIHSYEQETLVLDLPDGYAAAVTIEPLYTSAGALTVTRHNYIDLNDVVLGGAAALTDGATFRFDAAAGTHAAVDAGTTKTSPGTVSAWQKCNLNGTIVYIPMYTSKTS